VVCEARFHRPHPQRRMNPREIGGRFDGSAQLWDITAARPSSAHYMAGPRVSKRRPMTRSPALRICASQPYGSRPPSAGLEVTHRGVVVHDRDCARSGGEGFRAHDLERIVEGHHFAAMHAPGAMHVIVASRTPTGDEAVFPQLK